MLYAKETGKKTKEMKGDSLWYRLVWKRRRRPDFVKSRIQIFRRTVNLRSIVAAGRASAKRSLAAVY